MPPKKVKKTKISNVKAEASAVKTVVNVRVGDQYTKKKTVKHRVRRAGGGGDSGLAIFNRPLPVATQSFFQPQAQAPIVNEYNELLRELAAERRQRMASAPPLAPNTAPLTTNEQRNELLSKQNPRETQPPIVQAFAIAEENLVNKETYDDPLTNENMFIGASRLARNIAQKLPVSNFDYNDLETYDDENDLEQEALEDVAKQSTLTTPQKKYENVSQAYEEYMNYLREANMRYGINEAPKSRRSFNSIKKIREEVQRIQDLTMKASATKLGRG